MDQDKNTIEEFHKILYKIMHEVWWTVPLWRGCYAAKNPIDLMMYSQIIFETKPDFIIECGTQAGGSAAFMADMCNLNNKGKVITIDINKSVDFNNERIYPIIGDCIASVSEVIEQIKDAEKVMVVLDCDHTKEHVLQELKHYAPLVTKGNYLIVEDTNINGNPVFPEFGFGPNEALQEFLKDNKDFEIDKRWERFLVSFNPGGYLKRK